MTVKITMTVYSEKNLWKMPFWPPHEMLLLLTHYYDLLQMLLGTTFKKFTNKVKKKNGRWKFQMPLSVGIWNCSLFLWNFLSALRYSIFLSILTHLSYFHNHKSTGCQWLRFHTSTTGVMSSVPCWGTKILHVAGHG